MATAKRPPSGVPGARRKRPAPTLDLTATEVATSPEPTPAQAEPQAAAAPPPEPPHSPPNEPPRAASGPPPPGGVTWLPPEFPWPAAVAGALGAAAVVLVVLLIWLIVPPGDAVATLTPRLASIETQLRDLAARPTPAGVDAQAIEALSARLAKIETAISAPRAAVTDPQLLGRLGSVEGLIKPLSDSMAALGRRADENDATLRGIRIRIDTASAALTELQNSARASSADHGEIARLSGRIAALEKADRAVADQLAKAANDRPVRLAVTAAVLRTAVERGDPFAAELAAVKPLTSDTQTIAAIEPFAASGVPSNAVLGRELIAILPVMQRAAGATPRDGGLLDRLQANAERLVRIRPVGEVSGDDAAAALSRIEAKANQSDIAGALAELAKLPPAVRVPALAWIARAESRDKAIEASRRLAADAVSALKAT